MKKLILSLFIGFLFTLSAGRLSAQAGQLDISYGTGGKVNTLIGASGGVGWGMCSVDGWSVVVGGLVYHNSDSDFALTRFQRNGSLDSTFGVNGSVSTHMGDGSGVVYSTVAQPDGKILAAGMARSLNKYVFAVARYTSAGVLDSSFGTGGKIITAIGSGDGIGSSMVFQDGWSIVVGGTVLNGTDSDFALIRYTPNGVIDSSFGTNGIVMTDMAGGSTDILGAIAIQPDSSIVVAGTSSSAGLNHFAVARYTHNGTLDNNFGTNGKVVTPGTGDDIASALTLQPDGKIIIGGYSTNGVNDDFGLMRYMPNGAPDNSFGINGHVITAVGDSDEAIYSMSIQPDGKIIGAGSSIHSGLYQNAMVRYHTDGSPDSTFGTDGKVTTVISASNNEIYAVSLEHDGKILTAGYANDGTNTMFSMARYISGLSLGLIDLTKSTNTVLIYPNPVAPNATLEYTLGKDEQVSIHVLDVQGRLVQTITEDQKQTAGDHKQSLLLSDSLASGSYILVISSPSGQMSIKIVK